MTFNILKMQFSNKNGGVQGRKIEEGKILNFSTIREKQSDFIVGNL